MSYGVKFNLFESGENRIYFFLKKIQEPVLRPAVLYLAKTGIKPASLSYLHFLMVVPFVLVFGFLANPWLAFIFVLAGLVLDMLDGSLARYLKTDSEQGAFIDVGCDYGFFFILAMTFLYFEVFNQFWGAVYLLNYSILLFLVIIAGLKKIKLFPHLRSKSFFYLLYFIWIISGANFFNQFLILFSVYMIFTNFFIFDRIKCSLR